MFAGTIEQMLEAEMEKHLGYEKHSIDGNNTGNIRNGYGKKQYPAIMVNVKLLFHVTATENLNLKL